MPSVLVLNEAVVTPPLLLTLTAPPALLPSMVNCTVPVGVPAPGAVTAMVAVKVTFCPETPGFGDAPITVLVFALFTVWLAVLLLVAKLLSPL